MRINVADSIRLGQQPVSRVYLGSSLVWTTDPALDLVFDGRTLDPRMSFSRPSTATLFNSSGVLLSAAIDQPRYDHDPVTLVPRGLLVEEQRTNTFGSNPPYKPQNLSLGVFSGQAVDGTTFASRYIFPVTSSQNIERYLLVNAEVSTGSYLTISMFFKKPEGDVSNFGRYLSIIGSMNNFNFIGGFDIVAGVFNRPVNQAGFIDGGIVKAGSWYRVWATINPLSSGFKYIRFQFHPTISPGAYIGGDGVSGVDTCGLQVEFADSVSSYIGAASTGKTRAADTAALNPQGWLSAEKGVFVLQHDVPAGRPLLGKGSAALLNSVGPGRTAFCYDGLGAIVVHNGGAPQSAAFPAFADSLQLLGAGAARANAAVSRLTYYPRRLTVQELQEMTA